MANIRLVASTYAISQYITVTNPNNMYTNTDSTTYATAQNTNASTSSRYLYIRGFNFDDVPANAVVSSFEVKIKGYESGLSTSTSYAPRLANSTTAISGTTASDNFGTSSKTITIPTGNLEWSDLVDYYDDFTVMVYVRRNSRNTVGYAYIQGVEINVTYTVPVYHTVSITGTNVTPSGTQSVLEGESLTMVGSYSSKPTVTDNNVNVTSQLVEVSSGTETLIPYDYTSSNITVTNISNAYADATSTNYASLEYAGSTTGTIYLDLGGATIPSGASIQSVSCSATLQYSRNGSSSGFTASCQMYANTTAKGSSTSVVSSGGSDVAKTTFNLTVGSWTASEIANARFYITATNSARSTKRYIYVYGVSFNVTYSFGGVVYVYTITNITTDHTVVWTESASPPVITVGTPSRTIISDETGYDQCVCTFTSDLALQQWEARATKSGTTPARGVGLLVESGTTLAAGATGTIYVDNEELTNGDGVYTITVYGQSTGGVWSE